MYVRMYVRIYVYIFSYNDERHVGVLIILFSVLANEEP